MKKKISMILAIMIVFAALPMGDFVAWAEGEPISKVTEIDIIKNFDKEKRIEKIIVKVIGENVDKSTAHIDLGGNESRILNADNNSTNTFRQYVLTGEDIAAMGGIGQEIIIKDDVNSTKRYDIGDLTMPTVSSISPASGQVKTREKVTIVGDRLDGVGKNNITAYFGTNGSPISIEKPINADGNIVEDIGTQTGRYSVVFTQNETRKADNGVAVKIKREHHYLDLFTVYGELNITGDITMFPNQGVRGSEVTIKAKELPSNLSVFFLKNEKDILKIENMGEYVKSIQSGNDKDDEFVVKVPNLDQGQYSVILTNKVEKGQDPEKIVNSSKTFNNNTFIIISDGNKSSISQITPKKGPATGIPATITGRYLGSISPSVVEINSDAKAIMEPKQEGDKGKVSDSLSISYGDGEGNSIGKYKMINTENGGVDVLQLKRTIKGSIGNRLSFREGSRLSVKGEDSIEVNVPQVTDGEDPVKDIVLDIETTIKYRVEVVDGDGNPKTEDRTLELKETVIKTKGFTFERLGYEPKLTDIIPNKIPVELDGNSRYKTSLEDMKIAIYGQDFSVYRYVGKNKDGEDIVSYKYPIVNIGNQIILDKNLRPEINIKIFDKNGNEIDGSEGNNLGVKILITIPKGSPGTGLAEGQIGGNIDTWVRNPLRNSNPKDMGSISNTGAVQFVNVEASQTPTITSLTPNTVTVDGEKGVIIKGEKFYPGVKLYIDGVEVKNAKRNDIGNEIIFDAPPGKEGFAQIIVQNEEGGADIYYPFTYVKTYTNPKIIDFNPKKGTANTLVTVSGKNLVLPNPLVTELEGIGIWKLIGTRILLGRKDINQYYMPEGKKSPGLQEYEAPVTNPLIAIDKDGRLKLSDYYHSIILQEGPDKAAVYYTISFDTKSGDIKLSDGDKQVYIIEKNGNDIIGKKDGKDYDLIVSNKDLVIDGKTLKIRTPYAIEKDEIKGDKITGNKVKVINNNELIFNVPPMPREGYYDLSIVNPDTNKDSKTGNNGFYYSFQPDHKPKIEDIKPNEGSVDGDYYINISGEGFIDRGGNDKISVVIGSVVVDPKDVEVSPNGKNIQVKVPKYPGNLATETDMDRKSVSVVIVNPDGGSDSVEGGFNYIIPISHPKISKLILNKGSAAGGDSVIIEGSQFRFFEPFKDLNNNQEWDSDEPYTDLNNNDSWDDLRHWLSDDKKDKYDKLVKNYDQLVRPILPKVYFGGKEVKIIDFTASTIEVETPKGAQGVVEVYLVNNDHGVSNKLNYNYEASNPRITSITPSVGRKRGKDKIEILGEGFHESQVKVIQSDTTNKEESLQIIQFGNPSDPNISNRDIAIDAAKNSGKIRDKRSRVEVGDLTVEYSIVKDQIKLDFTITEGMGDRTVEYKLNYVNYDDEEIFFPVNLLKNDKDEVYDGSEYIKIILERVPGASSTNRLRVDRGFSPNSNLRNSGHVNVETPSYYTIGNVPLNLINSDGGTATTNFEYKNPDSKPTITNILRDGEEGYATDDGRIIVRVPYTGGNNIEILGTDFRKSADPNKKIKVTIGGIEVNTEIKYDPDENISTGLYFEMPPMNRDLKGQDLRVVVENPDGGIATSEPIFIHIIIPESEDLKITGVTPNFGPTAGGTVVTIEGEDFRKPTEVGEEELKVYFGRGKDQVRVPNKDILEIGPFKIVLRIPAYTAGLADIKVVNPDGNIAILKDGFNYVSNPKINSVVDRDNDKMVIQNISVEGGEKVKILGSDFMEGARVVFAPVLRELGKDEESTGDVITVDTRRYVLESGVEGREVERVNGQTILVTTPAGKLGDKGLIVINPDKCGTNVYNIVYGIPEIGAPFGVEAEVVFDQFIRVNWTGVKDALEYEIYMSEDGEKFEFIGSTELTSFAVEKLRRNTRYQFLVRAIGQYGTSKPIDESKSNTVRTGRRIGPEDEDGELAEETVINRNGSVADVIIGSKDFRSEGLTIDLTRGELAGVKDVNIRIPAKIISDTRGLITVLGKDYSMKFSPNVFKSTTMNDNRNNSGAGVIFSILSHNEGIDVQGGQTIVGEQYLLKASSYVDKDMSAMDYLNGGLDFIIDHDNLKAQTRKLNNVRMVRYDASSKSWMKLDYTNRLGLYTVIGSRR